MISRLFFTCEAHMLQMCAAFIYVPAPYSWLWPFLTVFNMDIHEAFSTRTSAPLSSAPSEPLTVAGFVFMVAMHTIDGKIATTKGS